MNKVWRPVKITEKIVQKLQEAFKIWSSVEEACCYADISRSTYYDWISKNKEFSDKIELSKKYLTLKSRMVIANSLEKWDIKTAMWYLERKRKDEFSINSIVDTEDNIFSEGIKVNIVHSVAWQKLKILE